MQNPDDLRLPSDPGSRRTVNERRKKYGGKGSDVVGSEDEEVGKGDEEVRRQDKKARMEGEESRIG